MTNVQKRHIHIVHKMVAINPPPLQIM